MASVTIPLQPERDSVVREELSIGLEIDAVERHFVVEPRVTLLELLQSLPVKIDKLLT